MFVQQRTTEDGEKASVPHHSLFDVIRRIVQYGSNKEQMVFHPSVGNWDTTELWSNSHRHTRRHNSLRPSFEPPVPHTTLTHTRTDKHAHDTSHTLYVLVRASTHNTPSHTHHTHTHACTPITSVNSVNATCFQEQSDLAGTSEFLLHLRSYTSWTRSAGGFHQLHRQGRSAAVWPSHCDL